MSKIKEYVRPARQPDVVLPKEDGRHEVQVWLDEDLFYICNGYIDEDMCLGQISAGRISSKRFFKAVEYLEYVVANENGVRKDIALTFLVERGLLE